MIKISLRYLLVPIRRQSEAVLIGALLLIWFCYAIDWQLPFGEML